MERQKMLYSLKRARRYHHREEGGVEPPPGETVLD
jgi:hypothetical protein